VLCVLHRLALALIAINILSLVSASAALALIHRWRMCALLALHLLLYRCSSREELEDFIFFAAVLCGVSLVVVSQCVLVGGVSVVLLCRYVFSLALSLSLFCGMHRSGDGDCYFCSNPTLAIVPLIPPPS
jgi:hypothetical protein